MTDAQPQSRRGRPLPPEIARELLLQVAKETEDIAAVEQVPALEGRSMLMVLTPKK